MIGAGGMGEVYRARDTRLNRDVAIKVLPDSVSSDPERVARLEREARTLAALNHPHIGAIYDFEQGAGASRLVLELLRDPRWPTVCKVARSVFTKLSPSPNKSPTHLPPRTTRRSFIVI